MKPYQRLPGLLIVCLLLTLMAGRQYAGAMQPMLEFDEIAQTADAVFVGTVIGKQPRFGASIDMIETDVIFGRVEWIKQPAVPEAGAKRVTLTFAGGTLGPLSLRVSDMPGFILGQRYMVFALMDGRKYINPLVGGTQGLFRIVPDRMIGISYVVSATGRGVVSAAAGRLQLSGLVDGIDNGRVLFKPRKRWQAHDPECLSGTADAVSGRREHLPERILTLQQFVVDTRRAISGPPPLKPVLQNFRANSIDVSPEVQELRSKQPQRSSRVPAWWRDIARRIQNGEDPDQLADEFADEDALQRLGNEPFRSNGVDIPGVVGATGSGNYLWLCGYRSSYPIPWKMPMQESMQYPYVVEALDIYNVFGRIFKNDGSKPTYGQGNGDNDVIGFLTDGELRAEYDKGWGSGLAICLSRVYYGACGKISESDIAFNAHQPWTFSYDEMITHQQKYLYQPGLMHELGHSWGLNRGDETYDYDVPSVMHGGYRRIMEDGRGLHARDVNRMRYALQHSGYNWHVPRNDLGVESYYADGGLRESHITPRDEHNNVRVPAGSSIRLHNITVENMSSCNNAYSPPCESPGVLLRVYLSPSRQGSDHLLGTLAWDLFPAETIWTGSWDLQIPEDFPAGAYYVVLEVSGNYDEPGWDNYPANNRTSFLQPITVTCPAPSCPTGLSATSRPGGIRVIWNRVSGALDYSIQRQHTSSPDYHTITPSYYITGNGATMEFTDWNAYAEGAWRYRIAARSACGSISSYTVPEGARAGIYAPTVAATGGVSTDYVEISWNIIDGAKTYTVLRSLNNDPEGAEVIGSTVATRRWFRDTTARQGFDYHYWVKATAYNTMESALSPSATGWRALTPPYGFWASNGTNPSRIELMWDNTLFPWVRIWRGTTINSSDAVPITGWIASFYYYDSDINLVREVPYYYWMQAAVDSSGTRASEFSAPRAGWKDALPLSSPASVTATAGTTANQVRVSWDGVAEATRYRVFRADSDAWEISAPVSGWIAGTAYSDNSVVPGTTYYYFVSAATDDKGTRQSSIRSSPIAAGWRPLAVPANLQASSGSNLNAIDLSWSPVDGATWYHVYRLSSGSSFEWISAVEESGFDDTSVRPCLNYTYRITAAVSDDGDRASTPSGSASGYRGLASVDGISAGDGEYNDRIVVQWPTSPRYLYRAFRGTTSDPASSTALGKGFSPDGAYTDHDVTPGCQYYYWVKASITSDGTGCSSDFGMPDTGWSALDRVISLTASDGAFTDRVQLTWNTHDAMGATHFKVFRSTNDDFQQAELLDDNVRGSGMLIFDDTAASAGQQYYYWIIPCHEDNPGYEGPANMPDTGWRALPSPGGLIASQGIFSEFVAVRWDPVPDATHYRVSRVIAPACWNDPPPPPTCGLDDMVPITGWTAELQALDTKIIEGASYLYWVQAATDASGASASDSAGPVRGWAELGGTEPPAGICGNTIIEYGEECETDDDCREFLVTDEFPEGTWDFGRICEDCLCRELPVLITLSDLKAEKAFRQVVITWVTGSEVDNAGFNLYRADTRHGRYEKITLDMIPATGSEEIGAGYRFVDEDVIIGKRYWYKLEDIDTSGRATFHGPVRTVIRRLARPAGR